jgi:hypothetical protein
MILDEITEHVGQYKEMEGNLTFHIVLATSRRIKFLDILISSDSFQLNELTSFGQIQYLSNVFVK